MSSGEEGPTPGELHHHRRIAESFGTDAERYDRARPRYPVAMVERIVAASPGRDVLDVGVGTGIAARQFEALGCRVTGVDVDARMADFARRSGLHVEVATFDEWDPSGRSFDLVISGQAWHWIDPIVGARKAAAALRPDGRLAVFWNADLPPPDLADAFGVVYRRVMPDALVAHRWTAAATALEGCSTLGSKAADGIRRVGSYRAPEQWRFEWERRYTRDEWLDQVPTTGDHSQVPTRQLDELLAGIGAAIDARGGEFTMNYVTLVVTARKLSAGRGLAEAERRPEL